MNLSNKTSNVPVLSIICITFNQEKYIRQTIESFLMQKTDFLFEIIIHDDASTDGTTYIIDEYRELYPDVIKPIYQAENKYSCEGLNFQFNHVFPHAIGKYIAFCEGDDYWIDPLKLQKQVSFLEQNIDFGMVHTKAVQFSQKDNMFSETIGYDIVDFEGLLFECTVSNLTVVLRNDLLKKYIHEVKPQQKNSWSTVDYPIWLYVIQNSKIKFIDEPTGVYRLLETSICHHKNDEKRLIFQQGIIDIVEYFLSEFKLKQNSINKISEKKILSLNYSRIISNYFFNKKWRKILKSLNVFYEAKDWSNFFWCLITIPFFRSYFLSKSSYFLKRKLINI